MKTHGLRVGATSMAMTFTLRLLPDRRSVPRCPTMGKYAKQESTWYRDTLTELLAPLAAGRVTPVVAERVRLAEADRSHELLEACGHAGKFVLVTDAYSGAEDTRR